MVRILVVPVLVVALAGALVGAASAQDASLYLTGSLDLPSDPPEFRDFWKVGGGVEVGVGLRLSHEWEMLGRIGYQRFPADGPAQAEDLLLTGFGVTSTIRSLEGRDATVLTLLAESRLHLGRPGSRWGPFLAFGWGYFELSTSDATVYPEREDLGPVTILGESDAAFAVLAGAGLDIPVSDRWRALVELDATIGFTEPVSTQYLALRAGVGLSL